MPSGQTSKGHHVFVLQHEVKFVWESNSLSLTLQMLKVKIQKLEQLLSLKDKKIDKLAEKLSNVGIS